MDLISAIKSAIDGRALLILGAGFSRNAYNLRHCSMPSADGLRKLIYSEICHEDMDSISKEDWEDLEDLVDRCVEEGRSDELCQFLKECFIHLQVMSKRFYSFHGGVSILQIMIMLLKIIQEAVDCLVFQ